MSTHTRFPSPLSLIVFITGLVAAAYSSVATYRAVGVYGGPTLTGFHREWDPRTGRRQLVHETTSKAGVHVRRLLDDEFKVQRTELSGNAISKALADPKTSSNVTRAGFSTRNDGVIDAWAIRDTESQISRIEVSTKRDGKIDRWEHYAKGQMTRVDLDTDGNGKADRWMTYEEGILMETFIDADEDGQPDDYRR